MRGPWIAALALFTACGDAANIAPRDAVPQGTIVVSGEIIGKNGKTASGVAKIYKLAEGSYVVRLEGVVLPEELGLQVIPMVNGTATLTYSLKSSRGDQNYTLDHTGSGALTFNSVRIHSPSTVLDYAEALLR